jgi:hypothetical protein
MGKIGKFFKKATDKVVTGTTNISKAVTNTVVAGTVGAVAQIKETAVELKQAATALVKPEKCPPPPPPPPPPPVLSCNEKPYNISNMNGFNNYSDFNSLTQYQRNKWLVCLNENVNSDNINKDNIVNTYNLLYNNNETTNEMNKYSLYLYNNDLIYIYSKVILLFILGAVYFYFFKTDGFNISGIIDSSKMIIQDLPNIKKNIENKIK